MTPEREAEAALLARMPQRMVPDLDRIIDLTDLLGSPQRAYPSIHVTGTNGKTSTARMIDALLRSFGLTTGRATSPHLESMRERISLDGEPLTEEQFAAVYAEVAPYAELVDGKHPDDVTFHEMLTAMAFAAFADAPVDVAVVEVGMGGRWDATNVMDGQVAVVTPIGLDHTEWLGDTIAKIAEEKAGIIKPGAALVMSRQPLEAATVLLRKAGEVGATVAREGLEYGVVARRQAVGGQLLSINGLGGVYDEIFLNLQGPHQASNAATALAAVESFLGGGVNGQLDLEAVREGFANADSPGRLEVVRRNPTVLLDGAHNPAGAQALATAVVDGFDFTRLVGVIGVLADKDVRGVLEALEPVLSAIVVTQNASPRAMPAEELGGLADEIFGRDRVEVRRRLDDAIESAIAIAEDETEYGGAGVLVFGSLVTVGEARTLLRRR
ncbi:MAG: dihydrofolate synthase / folylpolyglutamate synthase [Frankiales bacterium]|jgi:dihydrofolate synthase/folylpolyglutamate synthase|nr:dihydrofolate synthase / folylpolyglutamate synthase [Frankiales bacterium]